MGRRFVNVVIEEIGIGPYQLVVLLLVGGVYAAEGALLLIVGIVAKGLTIDWNLTPLHTGAMAFTLFLVTYGGIVVFLITSMISNGYVAIMISKFMLGLFMGFGLPAANVMICESVPAAQRSSIYSMSMIMFAFGQMYSAVALWTISPTLELDDLNWRLLLGIGVLPALLLFIGAYFFLRESPYWLAAEQRVEEAEQVLMYIAKFNGVKIDLEAAWSLVENRSAASVMSIHSVTPRDRNAEGSKIKLIAEMVYMTMMNFNLRIRSLFGDYYRTTTIMISSVCFITNMSYYGLIYAIPRTLQTVSAQLPINRATDGWSAAGGVFVATLFEIPGVILAILFGSTIPRRANMALIFSLSSVCLIIIPAVGWHTVDSAGFWLVSVVKMFIASGFIIVYLYMLECYPTFFRATGLAFNMIVGRIGAISGPVLYEVFMVQTKSFSWFFLVLGVFTGCAALLCWFLPFETKDKSLVESC
eukprot:GEMP01040515.1.p1 GENE.GEMP01040515.1~~GEMP01040515.1.p1  ORF type:complete len:472 (+),score=59.96 GEMP01040515.1:175-1590(+)